jgi:dehydrodolichyl diphosphate syntase complex subunit NUS1
MYYTTLTHPPVIARDVKSIPRLPKHLSVVLSLPPDQKDVSLLLNRLDGLIHDACEIAAWSTAAGIPILSIYERSGKSCCPSQPTTLTSQTPS